MLKLKLFLTRADRHNGILTSLLLLVSRTIIDLRLLNALTDVIICKWLGVTSIVMGPH